MDIASPRDHRVYEKQSEKVEKYQDLKKEIRKLWSIRRVKVVLVVVGELGAVSKRLAGLTSWGLPLKRVCSRKQLCWELRKDFKGGTEKLKGGELTQGTFGLWL